ncbi:hypothetical protein RDV64_14680 [Acuticoccus sp. MNP-M23]|uniref:hypothetical protein n=1 Tax=Acuticoccus sp. MNP-M23 TaxID=3072793 RepID=UPI002816769A|nr:hypothetical protein [Acuticoccus sp. MNP-M23]WMS41322.1 hypothetical protein RDV64_14680 [Acuticoccus sp. MNP-M23]
MQRTLSALALTLILAAPPVGPVMAQSKSVVEFAPGNFGTMVNGTIEGDEYIDYMLGAKAGQEMFIELTVDGTNGTGSVYFNVLPPESAGEAIYNSSIDGNSTTVPLPSDGDYAIRVYQMGTDADAGKTAGFRIDLSIQ